METSVTRNRRSRERYKTVVYSASIKRHGLPGSFKPSLDAAVINFNRFGMAVCCERKFNVGDKINIQMHSICEQVNDICAVVRYVENRRREYIIGLQFVEADDFTTEISNVAYSTLACMERVIKHQLA